MTITELINALESIRAEHGNLECDSYGSGAERINTGHPSIMYRKILGKRERKNGFYCSIWDAPEKRGEKVVRI